jgi:hypothetical protein
VLLFYLRNKPVDRIIYEVVIMKQQIPVSAQSKPLVARLLGLRVRNRLGYLDVCLLCILCVVQVEALRRADPSTRGVLPSV